MKQLSNFLNVNEKKIVFILVITAFVLRLVFSLNYYVKTGTDNWVDAKYYLELGEAFSHGNFYPEHEILDSMVVGPALPLVVALLIIIFGDPIVPIILLNCLLGAITVYVLYLLGKKIINGKYGLVMGIWFCLNGFFIKSTFRISKEPYLLLLIPVLVLALFYFNKKLPFVLSVFVFSLIIHIDERYIAYIPILILLLVFPKINFKRIFIWLGLFVLTLIPWTVRNYHEFGELVILTPRTTSFTSKLWGTNFSHLHFESEENLKHHGESYGSAVDKDLKPYLYGKYERYYKAFWHYWVPTYFKTTFIQSGFREIKMSMRANIRSIIVYGIFIPFYILGICYAFIRRRKDLLLLSSIPIINSLLHTLMIWPLMRYRMIFDFIMVLISLWFINEILVRYQKNNLKN